jgi:hypothetical protein
MLFILDDDQFNSISTSYKCDFIFRSPDTIRYYRSEDQIDFSIEELKKEDFVCYHNSFPCDKTLITNRLLQANEKGQSFTLICFSAAAEFYNLVVDKNFIKIHKDRFYHNLKEFVLSDFNLDHLLYGAYSKDVELSIIQNRIYEALFQYSKTSDLPIKELQPRDLKRLCELTGYKYQDLIEKIAEFNVDKFKRFISVLIQSK